MRYYYLKEHDVLFRSTKPPDVLEKLDLHTGSWSRYAGGRARDIEFLQPISREEAALVVAKWAPGLKVELT